MRTAPHCGWTRSRPPLSARGENGKKERRQREDQLLATGEWHQRCKTGEQNVRRCPQPPARGASRRLAPRRILTELSFGRGNIQREERASGKKIKETRLSTPRWRALASVDGVLLICQNSLLVSRRSCEQCTCMLTISISSQHRRREAARGRGRPAQRGRLRYSALYDCDDEWHGGRGHARPQLAAWR